MRSGRSRSSLDVLDDPLAAAAEEKKKRGHVLSYLTMEWSKQLGKQLEEFSILSSHSNGMKWADLVRAIDKEAQMASCPVEGFV
ncbi:hypothetical protein Tco_0054308 [Tanacetum coccineum]